jgi:hypothetical protein
MKGTSLGLWVARAYRERLLALKAEDMPEHTSWKRDDGAFVCRAKDCLAKRVKDDLDLVRARKDNWMDEEPGERFPKCPECCEEMQLDHHAGERVNEGRYFYGLTFHDPNYDPGKAVIGVDCSDRTMSKPGEAEGMTVADAETQGISVGLERYQAIYTASSKTPTERHTIPSIDGACGFSSVEQIMKAIGLTLEWMPGRRNRRDDLYLLHDAKEQNRAT